MSKAKLPSSVSVSGRSHSNLRAVPKFDWRKAEDLNLKPEITRLHSFSKRRPTPVGFAFRKSALRLSKTNNNFILEREVGFKPTSLVTERLSLGLLAQILVA